MSRPTNDTPHESRPATHYLLEHWIVRVASIAAMFLGVAVILGWVFREPSFTHLHQTLPPMQLNTAVGFVVCGLGLLAFTYGARLIARISGGIALAIGVLTLFQYATGFDIGIDDFLMDQSPNPNRMAVNTALSFTFVSSGLLIASIRRFNDIKYVLQALLSSVALVLGMTSVIGYLANLETAYGWGGGTRMALHTSSGFAILGSCGLTSALMASSRATVVRGIRWVPGTAAFSICIFSLLIWQALQAAHARLHLQESQTSTFSILSWFILLGGLVLGWLFYISLSRSAIAREEIAVRVKTEEHLNEVVRELQLQKSALDQHSIVAITDPHGIIKMVNDRFCEISGYNRDELVGKTHRVINSGTHNKEFFVELWRTITGGRTWHGEICNRAKDGSLYWVDTTIVPFSNSKGETTQYVAIRTDITAHKLAESKIMSFNAELQQRNEEMEQFAYTVSHDLKSPTVTIRGYVGYLLQDLEQQRHDRIDGFIESIVRATDKMRNTIDDLLELSRVGRMTHDMSAVELDSVIAAVLDDMKPQLTENEVDVTVDCNASAVWGDRGRLEQLLQNLLVNAIKYATRSGEVLKLRITTEQDHDMARLSVADNGPGIDPEYAERVFGLFERLKTTCDGTGIGLAIVKRIAEIHGGKAWVEPTLGGGATFWVTISCRLPSEGNAVSITSGANA